MNTIQRKLTAAMSLCAAVTLTDTAGADLISTYSFGSPESLAGTRTTLNDLLPARFQLIYGNTWLCDDEDCDFPYRNPDPPDATLFDVQITGAMSQSFVLDSGADFDASVALARDGFVDPMGWSIDYLNEEGGFIIGATESSFYDVPVDLSGFNISSFELMMNASFASPGSDPNGDGLWVERNVYWTFNVYGEPVPVPPAGYLFVTGLIGLAGLGRRASAR